MSRYILPVRTKLQAIAQKAAATLAALDEAEAVTLNGSNLTRVLCDLEEGGARILLACDRLNGAIDPSGTCCE